MTRRRRTGVEVEPHEEGPRIRHRGAPPAPELELTGEELRALADEGVDPSHAERVTRERTVEDDDVSDHDRDTARDQLEGLVPDEDAY